MTTYLESRVLRAVVYSIGIYDPLHLIRRHELLMQAHNVGFKFDMCLTLDKHILQQKQNETSRFVVFMIRIVDCY